MKPLVRVAVQLLSFLLSAAEVRRDKLQAPAVLLPLKNPAVFTG